MRIKLNLLSLVIVPTVFCQEPLADKWLEIFCGSENYSNSVEYSLEPIGMIWDVEWSTSKIFRIDTDGSSNGGLYIAPHNQNIADWSGYNYIASSKRVVAEDFGFGLYKLSAMGCYFYLDWRDTRYGSYTYCTGHCQDIWIKYDGNTGKLHYANSANLPVTWSEPIPNGGYLPIWVLKSQTNNGSPNTDNVPSFWQNCLVLIPSPNNNPHLVWGPYPNSTPINYKIYRHISQVPNPIKPTYQFISTVSSSTFDFIDYEIMLDQSGSYVFYYVNAILNEWNSSASNTVMTRGGLYKENTKNENVLAENHLYENYPNPFNPSTKISWQSPVSGWQTLKVYDVLGNEVATLVDEWKEAGSHQVEFQSAARLTDGQVGKRQLANGVYIYRLQVYPANSWTESFVETKKMILLR